MAGALILLFRTFRMAFFEGALEVSAFFVLALLFIEMGSDLLCIVFSLPWLVSGDRRKAGLPLRFGAFSTILHSLRVLVFVLGRTGPLVNFDINPEYRSAFQTEIFWVWFAAILSVLGVAGVAIIWVLRKKNIL